MVDLDADPLAKLTRIALLDLDALLRESRGNLRLTERTVHFGVQPLNDWARCALGRKQTDPGHPLKAGKSLLRHSRQIGKMLIAGEPADREQIGRASCRERV